MKFVTKKALAPLIIALSLVACTLTGCSGSDADRAAGETAAGITGKNAVEKGEKLKQQINEISENEIEKIQQDIRRGTYGQEQEGGSK